MNPTDAGRKQARKREINRNKKERDLQRATPKDVEEIRKRLGGLIDEEEAAKTMGRPISKDLHIRRKVLQDAMKIAVAKERVCNTAAHFLCGQLGASRRTACPPTVRTVRQACWRAGKRDASTVRIGRRANRPLRSRCATASPRRLCVLPPDEQSDRSTTAGQTAEVQG